MNADFNGAHQMGLGRLSGHPEERRTLERGARLSGAEPVAPQPQGHHRRGRAQNPVRRQARDRRRIQPRRQAGIGAGAARGHPLQRRVPVAATLDAVGHRQCGGPEGPRHRRRGSIRPASARTCRTISTTPSATAPTAWTISASPLPACASCGGRSGATGARASA